MTAAVYSTDRAAPLRLFSGHISDVTAVCWHENATLIATSSDDKTARLWDLRTGNCVRLFTGSPSPLSCVSLSPASQTTSASSLLAAGSDSGAVCLWDVGSGRHLAVLQGHTDAVNSVSFSPDGLALASGSADCSLRVFDINGVISAPSSITARPSSTAVAPPSSSSSSFRISQGPSTLRHGTAGVPVLCQPRHAYHTKFSPVYYVNFTEKNLIYSGGPFSLYCATTRGVFEKGGELDAEKKGYENNGEERIGNSVTNANPPTATEQETAAALGLSQSVISN